MAIIPQSPINTRVPSGITAPSHFCTHTNTHTRKILYTQTHIINPSPLSLSSSHTQSHTSKVGYSLHHLYSISVTHTHTHTHTSTQLYPPLPPQPCPTLSIHPAVCSTQSPLAYRLTFISWHHKPLRSTGLTYGAPCTQVHIHTLLLGSSRCRIAFTSPPRTWLLKGADINTHGENCCLFTRVSCLSYGVNIF